MSEKSNYYFKRLADDNFSDFVQLYCLVFKKNVSEEFLRKKYRTAYLIPAYWSYIAYAKDQQQAVAFYGMIPWLFNSDGKKILAAQTVDIMTASDHRGNGLIGQLHERVMTLLQEHHFAFSFTFPNQNSHPLFAHKFGWEFRGHLKLYLCKVAKLPIKRALYKFPMLNRIHDRYLSGSFQAIETSAFENSVSQEGFVGTWRTKEFLQNKDSASHYFIQLEGNGFWLKVTNQIIIGDIQIKAPLNFSKSLEKLKQLARKAGIDQMYFMCSEGLAINQLLAQHYPTQDAFGIGFFPLRAAAVDFNKIKFTLADLDTF